MKNNETEVIKHKYQEIIEEYKKDIDKTKKANKAMFIESDQVNYQFKYFKSTLNVFLDIIEIFVGQRNFSKHLPSISNINENNNSCSIDIYDSYHNDGN